jgi:hypothetical protein
MPGRGTRNRYGSGPSSQDRGRRNGANATATRIATHSVKTSQGVTRPVRATRTRAAAPTAAEETNNAPSARPDSSADSRPTGRSGSIPSNIPTPGGHTSSGVHRGSPAKLPSTSLPLGAVHAAMQRLPLVRAKSERIREHGLEAPQGAHHWGHRPRLPLRTGTDQKDAPRASDFERLSLANPTPGRRTGPRKNSGADGSRTHDLLTASQALSQLSYGPSRIVTGSLRDSPARSNPD